LHLSLSGMLGSESALICGLCTCTRFPTSLANDLFTLVQHYVRTEEADGSRVTGQAGHHDQQIQRCGTQYRGSCEIRRYSRFDILLCVPVWCNVIECARAMPAIESMSRRRKGRARREERQTGAKRSGKHLRHWMHGFQRECCQPLCEALFNLL